MQTTSIRSRDHTVVRRSTITRRYEVVPQRYVIYRRDMLHFWNVGREVVRAVRTPVGNTSAVRARDTGAIRRSNFSVRDRTRVSRGG